MTEGLWLLPTKGRPEKVVRFFERWRKTAAHTPGRLIVNADEDFSIYAGVPLPDNWCLFPVTASCVADAVNTAWMPLSDKDWVGLLCDDLHPETMEWDEKLLALSKPDHLVASANGSQEQRLHGALVYGGELLRRVGWMYPPGVKHSFHDDAWEEIGRQCRNIIKASDVMVRHVHEGTVDETGRKRNSYWNEDEKAFRAWRSNGASETIKRVIDLMKECGSLGDRPDLSGKSLMIAAPSYSGSYERGFMLSLQKTLDMLRAIDVPFEFVDVPFVAEPGLARSLIFGAFHRSAHTHLLQIDDDMEWSPRDVIRMLNSGFDFIAVAGPRKTEHPAVAAHVEREDADRTFIDQRTGAMSVTEVGAAFLMTSRVFVDRMFASYDGELGFETQYGSREVDLCMNVIIERGGKRTRLSEDYALCWRWRRIGGQVLVLPDARLGHVGKKTWEGCLSDLLQNRPPHAEAAD